MNDVSAGARRAIAETASGKVRGAYADGVFAFKGIPYGASTAGRNRFMPPQKSAPWAGVRDALSYGPMAMQAIGQWPEPWKTLMKGNMTWEHERSEDCLALNVWTPALGDGGKRPVMVWCHGGGFNNGTGDADWHDGTRLARHHDVVVVHFNHRLNVFGFLYLGELGGERYADSGNVGMLDIIAVLQWVRDNIERFGGDPGNVTIFGESGGGAKVTTLMAMPAAQGLFHKAIIESGSMLRGATREEATGCARALIDRLGVRPEHVDRLQEIPAEKLLEAKQAIENAQDNRWNRVAYKPVVDGLSLPRHPFEPDAPRISADVPMLIGVTRDEATYLPMFNPALRSLDAAGLFAELQMLGIRGAQAEQLVASYQARRPGASLIDLYVAILSDLKFRVGATRQAERKCAQGRAPAYMYLFAWEAPGGEYKAGHNLEVPFVFDNIDKAPTLRGANPDPRLDELARNASRAWVAFARTGNPNHDGLPTWQPYEPKDRATMVLDYTCAVVKDLQREDRLAIESAAGELVGL